MKLYEVINHHADYKIIHSCSSCLRSQTAKAWCSNVEFRRLCSTEKLTEQRFDKSVKDGKDV